MRADLGARTVEVSQRVVGTPEEIFRVNFLPG